MIANAVATEDWVARSARLGDPQRLNRQAQGRWPLVRNQSPRELTGVEGELLAVVTVIPCGKYTLPSLAGPYRAMPRQAQPGHALGNPCPRHARPSQTLPSLAQPRPALKSLAAPRPASPCQAPPEP